jgi:tetratricopeptide (TPR) repeat protein
MLLSRPGELVTREQLIARLWPHGVVDFDTALNSAVRRLRIALEDDADSPRYIETIPRRGYRFIGGLGIVSPGANRLPHTVPAAAAAWHRRLSTVALAAVLAGAIAVLSSFLVHEESAGTAGISANPQAQELYLRARHFFERRGKDDLEHARRYFEEALAVDPDIARAWSGLAGVYWIETATAGVPEAVALPRIREAAERALALDPTLGEAHVRLYNYHRAVGDPRAAEGDLQKAFALEPENPLVLSTYASLRAAEGQIAEAVRMQRLAVQAEPLSRSTRYNLACFLYYAGRWEEAEQELVRLSELDDDPLLAPELHGMLLVELGRYDEAIALAASWPEGADRDYVNALAFESLGRRAEADAALRRLIGAGATVESFRIAEVYAHRGDVESAFVWLQKGAAQAREAGWRAGGRRPAWVLAYSSLLERTRQDPRWAPWYAAARKPLRQANAG